MDNSENIEQRVSGVAPCSARQAHAAASSSGGAGLSAATVPARIAERSTRVSSPSPEDERYMRLAIEQARAAAEIGEVPIGAVVVYAPIDRATRRPTAEPRVIAQACNRREVDRDPAGHAEFIAMKKAAEVLDAWRLTDCTVYVTLEPCIMCAGLMHQARVTRCVYGARDKKAGALGTLYAVHADERLNHRFEVVPGVFEAECAGLLKSFFAARRKSKAASKGAESSDSEE